MVRSKEVKAIGPIVSNTGDDKIGQTLENPAATVVDNSDKPSGRKRKNPPAIEINKEPQGMRTRGNKKNETITLAVVGSGGEPVTKSSKKESLLQPKNALSNVEFEESPLDPNDDVLVDPLLSDKSIQVHKVPPNLNDSLTLDNDDDNTSLDISDGEDNSEPIATPSLVEQFDNCLKDYYADDLEYYEKITSEDTFDSLSEFLFGGAIPRCQSFDDILDFSIDSLNALQLGHYRKYERFFNSDFQNCARFLKCLEHNDVRKQMPKPLSQSEPQLNISTTSLVTRIADGVLSLSEMTTATKDEVIVAIAIDNLKQSSRITSLEKQMTELQSTFKRFASESTAHINKLATSPKEVTTQASVSGIRQKYGPGAWFPTVKNPSVDRRPYDDEYVPKVVSRGITIKEHKEKDITKKKWWAQAHLVEKATLAGTDHLSNLFKYTFSHDEYLLVRQFYGQTLVESKSTQLTIPINLKDAVEEIIGFVSFVSKKEEAVSATTQQMTSAGIDPLQTDARVIYQRSLGVKDYKIVFDSATNSFYNGHAYAKKQKMFRYLTSNGEPDSSMAIDPRTIGEKRDRCLNTNFDHID